MSKVLVIGAGGVGSVAVHKMAMNPEIFSHISLASRTKSKCDAIAASVKERCGRDIATYEIDAEEVPAMVRLIRETGNVVFQDPTFRTDLINYIHNCTMYDLIDGTVDPGTFSSSDDVWALMASPNPARFTTLTSAGGSITVDTCPNAYTNLMMTTFDNGTRWEYTMRSGAA